MNTVESRTVTADEADLRLDRWFRRHFPHVTHGRLEKLLETVAAAHAVEQVEADESNPITFLQQRAAERIGRVGAG